MLREWMFGCPDARRFKCLDFPLDFEEGGKGGVGRGAVEQGLFQQTGT